MKKFILLLVLIAGAAGGYAYWRKTQTADSNDIDNEIRTAKVERATIDLRVATTGKVVPNLDVDIKSKASGQIINLPFDISDSVTSGSLLAELDPIDEQRNVAQREAAMLSAQARLAQAQEQLAVAVTQLDTGTSSAIAALDESRIRNRDVQTRLKRQEELYQKRLVSKEDLDTLRADAATAERSLRNAEIALAETKNLPRSVEMKRQDIKLNESAIQQAQVDLDNARQRLRETKIFAPMDGVITSRPVQTGQIIASGISNVGGGTTLMTLSDLSHIFVNASVDEADVGKIKVGQTAIVTTDAYPNKRFNGKVTRIATKGTNTQNVVTFEVKIEVQGEGSADSFGGGRGGGRFGGGGGGGETSGTRGQGRGMRGNRGGEGGGPGGGNEFAGAGGGETSGSRRQGRGGRAYAEGGGETSGTRGEGGYAGGEGRSWAGGDMSGGTGGSGGPGSGRGAGGGGRFRADAAGAGVTSASEMGKGLLKPEMTANVEIQADRREDALSVPNEAIQSRGRFFYVEAKGTTETTRQIPVVLGITDGLRTEITSGTLEGQEIVLPAAAQSRWASRPGGQPGQGGQDAGRAMRMATRSLGGGGGGGGRGGR